MLAKHSGSKGRGIRACHYHCRLRYPPSVGLVAAAGCQETRTTDDRVLGKHWVEYTQKMLIRRDKTWQVDIILAMQYS